MITEIEFKRTSNIFINAGIVALYQYLKECEEDKIFNYNYSFSLNKDFLRVECEHLFILLEDIYYYMGKELYDTSGKNARVVADKYFFTNSPTFGYTPFYKMKTYGLGALITNDPVPAPKEQENAVTFENLTKTDHAFAKAVAKVYSEKKIKLKDFSINSQTIKKIIEDGRTMLKQQINDDLSFNLFLEKVLKYEKILREQLKNFKDQEEISKIFKEKDELIDKLRAQNITQFEFVEFIENKDNLLVIVIDEIIKNDFPVEY